MQTVQGLPGRAGGAFRADAEHWKLAPHQALALAVVPILIVLTMTAMVPAFDLFVWVTAEDSLMEWLQFLMVFLAGMLLARHGVRLARVRQRLAAVLALTLAAGLIFIAGEEIAWGQRLFGFGTPAALEAVNYQSETTIHNISSLHQAFIYAVMLGGLAAAAAPLAWWALAGQRSRSALTDMVVPPLCLIPAFIMPFSYRLTRMVVSLEDQFPHLEFHITKFSEVTELCLYFGVFWFAWLNVRRFGQRHLADAPAAHRPERPAQPQTGGT